MSLFGIGEAIQGVASIAQTAAGVVQANKNRKAAEKLRGEGEGLLSKTLAGRKDYQVAPEIQKEYDRSQAALGAPSQIQSAMEAQAETGASNLLGTISRNATSGAGAIAAAQAAEGQRQAGYQSAAVAGAGERERRLDRSSQAAESLAAKKDTAYDINQQQLFEAEYNRAQDMIGAGYQGQIGARTQAGNAWSEGFSALGKIGGSIGQ